MFCHNCGTELKDSAKFCPRCGVGAYDPVRQKAAEPVAPRENVALGTLGACVGALLGGGAIVLCDQMGIYSAFVGFILAALTILGYELLGKKRGAAGTVIVTLLILAVPYLADTVSWALVLLEDYEGLGLTVADGAGLLYLFLDEGYIDGGMYLQDLLMLYGFTALGAVAAFSWAARRAKRE